MKKNIYFIINKKNNNSDFSIETNNFISELLKIDDNSNEYKIYNINYIYNYLLNIFLKYKLYFIFLVIIIIILKKIIIYFLYKNVE